MIALIVAYDEQRVIGHGGKLPWHLPEDLAHFKELTLGKTVLMGRKTYESILQSLGKPLPKRHNIVVSKTLSKADGIEVIRELEPWLNRLAQTEEEVFVIGGRTVYERALPYAKRLYITHVKGRHEGDVLFPEVDFSHFECRHYEEKDTMAFAMYERKD
ncbi:MAG: dihydrofolate reductase [Acholeplasmatales bacterium]|nr:MAG: dihydrofolate reductase [Acholeplasmatales bacterium]